MWSIACLMRSAAEPWHTVFEACRRAFRFSASFRDRMPWRYRLRPPIVVTKPSTAQPAATRSVHPLTVGKAACQSSIICFASSSSTASSSTSFPGPAP